ncbi:(Na+)-NQR maturation NqrM [Aliivibrio sp. S4TY2]|uniref:(Na+)-NQR maturation NqrM n=1 Tax=Aliivibrio finisterrensis TaxID=511998 RepID=A0A4Q5KTR8_9GAMM|nr:MULTISPECIES: (Na+)-NQR maturation NqrM [Aliivibrio]MDD9155612.1 (Na+)-NQR maturation NqrM [Aliivibrio sp. S4TY2]MDD9160479.1 (Na+)-NQR maturation NqrM [Aliivibrio sp. S4TY1]MDD9164623.1 (Na+)-NQR maturation NqrM [Aliivibrio sp. S4MY2]MDD9168429.1 (Na+)-NQR maturation NqrM [Aliivibrio sp. S4MY4]MDD9177664.1 (Na+)-NQR maturation NqrM [Aliivibrio sp. A6]
MSTLLITFIVFILTILLMALGVIFGRKAIQGSCGGLNNVGVNKVCNCKTTCGDQKLYQISEPSER